MAKAMMINCGNALMLTWRPELLEGIDTLVMNCGSLAVSPAVNAQLNKLRLVMNAGDTALLEVSGPVVDLGENNRLEAGTDYTGSYLAANEDLLVTQAAADALTSLDGLYVPERLVTPEGLDPARLGQVTAGQWLTYPAGTDVVELEDVELTAELAASMPAGTALWTAGRLVALEPAALADAEQKGLAFTAGSLLCHRAAAEKYIGKLLQSKKTTLVPDGYAAVKPAGGLRALAAAWGSKLYVQGDLTLTAADLPALEALEGLVVEGRLSLPVAGAAAFRAMGGRAESIFPYEGTLWQVKGQETMTHAQLQAARDAGLQYTLQVSGHLALAEDVTIQDLDAILSVHYKGVVKVPGALRPLLAAKVAEGKGVMTDADDAAEISGEWAILESMGVKKEECSVKNMGSFRML